MKLGARNALGDLHLVCAGMTIHERIEHHYGAIASVIEVGCGSGKLSIPFALRGAPTVLLDPDVDMLEYSARLAQAAALIHANDGYNPATMQCQSIQGDGRRILYPDRSFDLAWNEGVIEHFDRADQVRMLSEMARVSNRAVVFIVPDAEHPENQRIAKEVHHHYVGMPDHETPLTRQDCADIAAAAGLRVIAVEQFFERLLAVFCLKAPMRGIRILDKPPEEPHA